MWDGRKGTSVLGEGSMGAALLIAEGVLGRSKSYVGRRGSDRSYQGNTSLEFLHHLHCAL